MQAVAKWVFAIFQSAGDVLNKAPIKGKVTTGTRPPMEMSLHAISAIHRRRCLRDRRAYGFLGPSVIEVCESLST
ncbi:hypothetical protein BaRGS_00023914 [Batillaria attramentaria]|uniref:Uncharacterized protein n=1 Tax=Batillaria attramentaria TaxID=370345 RepID=A0ABD0KCI2_9CAEN